MYHRITTLIKDYAPLKFKDIDIHSPWWSLFQQRATTLTVLGFLESANSGVFALYPLILSWGFVQYSGFINILLILSGIIWILSVLTKDLTTSRIQAEDIFSAHRTATTDIIKTDPVYHNLKQPGMMISKVDNGTNAIESIYNQYISTAIPVSTSIIVTLYLVFENNRIIGSLFALVSLCMLLVSYGLNKKRRTLIRHNIQAFDTVEDTAAIAISQAGFIRSLFVTKDFSENLRSSIRAHETSSWRLWKFLDIEFISIELCMNLVIFGIVAIYVYSPSAHTLNKTEFIAYLGILIIFAQNIQQINRGVRSFIQSSERLKDLFSTLKTFCRSDFPTFKP